MSGTPVLLLHGWPHSPALAAAGYRVLVRYATFERLAPAFENPDHVAVSIDSYCCRLNLEEGEFGHGIR